MQKLLSLLLSFFPALGFAQTPELPELSGQTSIGRVVLYKSLTGISWYAPVALSSRFACYGDGSERGCRIQVFNELSPDEASELNRLNAGGWRVNFFSDTDSQVVSGIDEQFIGLPSGLNGQAMLLKTLRPSRNAYAQYTFRASADAAKRLQQQYENGGLGVFQMSFDLHSQKTSSYIGFNNGACVREHLLEKKDASLDRYEVRTLLSDILKDCDFRFSGLAPEEAESYARYDLKSRYLSFGWTGYRINAAAVSEIADRQVVMNVVQSPLPLHCQVNLTLKPGALPTYECQ